jgi:signal transduction histidine kinase/ligand-binding sensor domain-containing protein
MRLLTCCCLLLLVHSSYAQQYLFARYTPKDGLINNRTRFLYQDSRGRLYISTFGGLSVYDGSRFINYTTDNGLATSLVNDIVEMGDDSVWIVPNGKALHSLVHGQLKDIHTADGFYPVINQLIRCSDDTLYAICDQGLFCYRDNRFVGIPLQDAQGRMVTGGIVQAVEAGGKLIILTDPWLGGFPGPAALVLYDRQTHLTTTFKTPEFYCLQKTTGGRVFIATSAGMRCLDPEALQKDSIHLLHLPSPFQKADAVVCRYFCFDHGQDLWFSVDQGITKLNAVTGARQFFTMANGLPPGNTTAILQDKEDNIWLANNRNGIVKLPSRLITWYPNPQPGFSVSDLSAVAGTDSVWLYDTRRHRFLLIRDGDSTRQLFLPAGDTPDKGVIYMGKNSWMTASNTLYSLQFLPDHHFRAVPIAHDSSFRFGGGSIDKNGNLILVSDKITFIPAGQTTPVHHLSQVPVSYLCDQPAIDSLGRLWVVTRGNQLQVYGLAGTKADLHLSLLASWSKLPSGSPRSITVDNAGHVYIGTRDHGLYCLFFNDLNLSSWKHLTTVNGLSENFIRYLQCDPDNTVWACTPAGLDRIRFNNSRFTIDNLTINRENSQEVYRISSTRQGIHWALVQEGYLKVDSIPSKRKDYHPTILFSEVWVNNAPSPDTAAKRLSLPYDHNNITFHIGVTSFIDEAQTRYSYLLEGSSGRGWSPFTAESAIYFVNLPPGKYTLKVKVQFLAGDYPDESSSYSFVIAPPWWQTWWFRSILAITLAALTFFGIRVYIRRRLLQQRLELENQQAIERERTRIATDMHDELGAGLSRIKFLSETIGIKKQQQLPIEEEITGIRRYSHEMIDKMGEIVWALNERNDSLSDLLSYTRSYAAEYLLQAGIRCQVEAPAELPSCFVSGEFRRNVYLTIKEALHNIVKHAQAEQVNIRMTIQPGKQLLITIEDDGVGFDRNNIRPFANGLNNMQRRIAELGGTLYFYIGIGTTIRLSVPL